MDTSFADAMKALEERVTNVVIRAEDEGLLVEEIAAELRRIANQIEEEVCG